MLRFHGSRAKKEFELRRLQLAPRRDAGGVPAHLPAAPRRAGTRQRREAAARYAELGSASSSSCRPTSRATSTTCTACARPSATGSPRRSSEARDRLRRLLPTAAAPAAGAALPRLLGGRPSRDREGRRARISACRCGPGSRRSSRPRSSSVLQRASELVATADRVRFPVNRHRVWQLVVDAVADRRRVAARRSSSASTRRPGLLPAPALVAGGRARRRDQARRRSSLFGFYNRWWRYVSTRDMWGAARGVTVASAAHLPRALRLPARAHLAAAARRRGARLPAAARVRRRLAPARAHADRAAAGGPRRARQGGADRRRRRRGAADGPRDAAQPRSSHYTPIGFVDDDPRKRERPHPRRARARHDRRARAPAARQPAGRGADRDPVGAGRRAPADRRGLPRRRASR